jgi:hypothetical protein
MGSKNVFFVKNNDEENILKAFYTCLENVDNEDSILVDEFIDSQIEINERNTKLGNRLRVYVSRCVDDDIKVTGILCNVGSTNGSISGVSSNSFSFEYFLNIYAFSDDYKKKLEEKLKIIGRDTMEAIIRAEKFVEMDTINSQTDFIGIDLVFGKNKEFYLIEVNDHESYSAFANYEIVNYPKKSKMLDKWIQVMLYRSYDYMISKKNIVIIDSYCFERVLKNELKIKHVLFDCDCQRFERDHLNDMEHAKSIVECIKRLYFIPDNFFTLNSKNTILVDKIKDLLQIGSLEIQSERQFTLYRNISYSYDIKKFQLKDDISDDEFPLLVKLINGVKCFKIVYGQTDLLMILKENEKCLVEIESYIFGTVYNVVMMVYQEDLIFLKIIEFDENLQEKMANVKYAAFDCCLKKGLKTGIVLLKIIFSIQGIKLLKMVNFIEAVDENRKYFDVCNVDFLKYFLMMGCNIKPMKF